MRALFILALCWLTPATAFASTADQPLPPPVQADPVPLSEQSLDQLFATLAKSGDPKSADSKSADSKTGEAAEAEIQRRWLHSGSDTIDLLMGWAQQAIAAKDYGRALDFLDQVIALKPDYAEGWNRRATLFFLENQFGKSFSDIEKVLALEPRHFGALAGFGMMLKEIDRKKEALAALKKAVAIDPYVDSQIRDTIKELEPEVDGRPI